ncbi:MAG: hypothetical protein RSB04_09815, partial [Gordonibacter sp.]|uniref:hypothetical protein n=1 Tax=Gordonibacter sp. TaxID=1968902 RepID=UPI002FCC54C9
RDGYDRGMLAATTAWFSSYKLKKNVSDERVIAATKKLHDGVVPQAQGFVSRDTTCKIRHGLTLFFGRRKKMQIMLRLSVREKKLRKASMLASK